MMTELDAVEDENMKDRLEFVSNDSHSTGVILTMHRHELPCALYMMYASIVILHTL